MEKLGQFLLGTPFATIDVDNVTGEKIESKYITGHHYLATFEVERILKQVNIAKIEDILNEDVYSEEFLIPFHKMLEKFVNEYKDMAYMTAIKQASELLDIINNG